MSKTVDDEGIKKKLLEVGLRLFAENGMSKFSVKELTDRANISVGSFYYYFESKEHFILECNDVYNDLFIMNLENILLNSKYDFIYRIDVALNLLFGQSNEFFIVNDKTSLNPMNLLMFENNLVERSQPVFEEYIKEGVKNNIFEVPNVKITSQFLASGLTGLLVRMEMTKEISLLEDVKKLIYSCLSI